MTKRTGLRRLGLDRFSGVYLWVLFVIVFGIWTPHVFLTMPIFHSVASSQSISGMIAIAVLIPLICGNFDLSVGANANMVGLLVVILQVERHWPLVPAVLVGVFVGVFIGWVNGFIVVKLRVNSFIATLGMGSILSAVQTIVTAGTEPNPVTTSTWNNLTQFTIGGFQIVVLYLLIMGIVAWWFLDHTPVGRYLYAIGGNREAARLSGVNVDRWSWSSLVIAGGIAGFSGVLFTSLTGPSVSFGPGLLLPAFAAVFLGSTQLRPGRFNVWGTLLAIYVLATGVEGLQLVSGQEWLSDMFNGVALIVAVALSVRGSEGMESTRRRIRRTVFTTGETEVPLQSGAPAGEESGDTSSS